ncbi:MAG: nucleoside deaminase [Chitinophagaceae bacterium]|nr:MAG: nucleoside deaminase [Chitinophagaceae bacterium]
MLSEKQTSFLDRAIELSGKGMHSGQGGPFGCVIVKDGEIVGEGYNMVTSTNDPTAHAEVVAIRDACRRLQTFQLEGCEVYTSCEPCPMCLGAIYWARPAKVYFANTRKQAAAIEFDDDFIYGEINALNHERQIPFEHAPSDKALAVFREWNNKQGRTGY